MRENISAADLRQEIAGFHDRADDLMQDINDQRLFWGPSPGL